MTNKLAGAYRQAPGWERVLAMLEKGPLESRMIYERLGRRRAISALTKLREERRIEKTPGVRGWQLAGWTHG